MEWNGKFIVALIGKDYGYGERLQNEFDKFDKFWYLHVEDVNHHKSIAFMKLADALIAVVPDKATGSSKIAHYLGAPKPIIVVGNKINSTETDLIKSLKLGIVSNWKNLPSALDELSAWATDEHERRIKEYKPQVIKKYGLFGWLGHLEQKD